MVTNFDDSHNFVQTLSFIFNYTDDHWVISEPDLTDLSSYPSKEIKGEKSIGQIACEAAIKKIEREKGIKLMYECIKNDNVKPLPEPFNKFLNGGIDHASPLEFQIHLLLKVFRAKRDFKLAKYAENLLSDLARSRVETEARGEVFDYNSAYRNYQKHQAKIK